jgi:hypothetical protein
MIGEPWHQLKTNEMGPAVQLLLDGYKKDQAGRRTRYVRNLELYEGRTMDGYSAHSYFDDIAAESAATANTAIQRDRCRLIRSAVCSAVSTIYAPQKPKPQFQTVGATWATRRKAYRLDRICEGILNQRQGRFINVWAFMADAATDTSLQGMACIKVTADRKRKRIVHENIPMPDLFTDPAEGREPQTMLQRGPIDEYTAAKKWPKAKQAIAGAMPYEWFGRASTMRPRATKVIEIVYAWRLPTGEDEPGRWCAVINGTVVDEGEWTAPAFPFVFFVWEPHRDGPWASGIADEGASIAEDASELNLRLMHRSLVASGKRIYYQDESVKPDDLMLNDAVVGVAVAAGAQYPQEQVATPFSPMELEFESSKKRDYWDSIGISQVSAAARREQGVQSGIAMMTLNDTKAGRQLIKGQRYEQAYVDLSHQYVWRLRELAEEDADFSITWPGKTMLRSVKWKDADIEDDSFSVSVAPSSALPHDPAGRQEMVQTLYQSSLISQETAKQLIGWPDLDSELNVENAEYEYIDSLIEAYLDAEQATWGMADYHAPEGFLFNKVGALRRFASAWFRARIDQRALPKEEQTKAEFNIGLLARYIRELDALMKPAEPEVPPEPAMPPPPPDMMGMPIGAPPGGPLPPPDQLAPPPPPIAA